MEPQFRYRAALVSVHDGDTVTVDIDLGLRIWARGQQCRLAGINAPELSTTLGKTAKQALVDKLQGKPLVVETIRDSREKYGRWLLRLHVEESHGWECVNDWMLANHYADPYDGGRR